MEAVIGLVVLFAIAYGWMVLKAKVRSKTNQAVFRGTHASGQSETGNRTEFRCPVPPAVLTDRIIAAVNARPEPPLAVGGLYLKQRVEQGLIYVCGNKVADIWVANVLIGPGPAGQGCEGLLRVTNWRLADGLVSNLKDMTRLRERVEQAVTELGGQTRLVPDS